MPFGIDDAIGVVGAVQSIIGGFGAAKRAKAAQEYRTRLLSEYGSKLDREYQDTVQGNLQALRRNSGILGDALGSRATDAASASVAAGVYNSTGVAGLVNEQADRNAALLLDFANEGFRTERALQHSSQQNLMNRKLGIADQDYQDAQGASANAQSGVIAALGSLSQLAGAKKAANDRNTEMKGWQSILQGMIQSQTGQSPTVQGMSPRNNGIYMNGNQGSLPLTNGGFTGMGLGPRKPRLY